MSDKNSPLTKLFKKPKSENLQAIIPFFIFAIALYLSILNQVDLFQFKYQNNARALDLIELNHYQN